MTTQQAVRRWIMTGAVTAITVTGSLYGAGLNEHLKVRKKLLESTPEEQIATLEMARADLVARKSELERKISKFRERRRNEQEQGQQS